MVKSTRLELGRAGTQQLERLLQSALPDSHGWRLTGLGEISSGWETTLLTARVEHKERGMRELVLRLYPGETGRTQARRDFQVMRAVARSGISVPQVHLALEHAPPFAEPLLVMERIQGPDLLAAISGARPPEQRSLLVLAVSALVKIHQIPWRELALDVLGGPRVEQPGEAFARSMVADLRQTAAQFGLREFEPAFRWLEQTPPGDSQLCVLHNDFHPQNLLLREGEHQLVVLDWSFAGIGDHRLDLAWSALQFELMLGSAFRRRFLQSYQALSGSQASGLEYFEVLKFTSRMLTIATWLDESVTIPIPKITRRALRGDYRLHVMNVYQRLKQLTGISLPSIEALGADEPGS